MNVQHAVAFAVIGLVYLVLHQPADHFVQTAAQAATKGCPGWPGRWACARHVATYTLTLVVGATAATWWLHLPVTAPGLLYGQLVSAGTHYFADRRGPLRRVAYVTGHRDFWHAGHPPVGSGAYVLDQAWHKFWLLVAAAVTVAASS